MSGNSLRNENIKNSRDLLNSTFFDDASFFDNIYFWELNDINYENKANIPIRLYKRSFSNASGVSIKFQSLYDNPIIVGDILFNKKSGEYYICTESFDIDEIHWQGKLTLCNWILKWQDKQGTIFEYPCYNMNATQYNSGEKFSKQITTGSSQHMITLPCDKNTVCLRSPQRFFLDKNNENPTSFIVTQNDTTSYNYGEKGLVKITVTEYEHTEKTDRYDLGICNYIEPVTKVEIDTTKNELNCEIVFNSKVIKSGGDLQKFTAKFSDDNSNEISKKCIWEVVCNFKDELYIQTEENEISIGIDNDNYIDEEIKLICRDYDNLCSSELIITVRSLL